MSMASVIAKAQGDEDVAALTQPRNYLEIGVEDTTKGSDKYGEYNGLHRSGVEGVANVGIRGGSAYQGGDGTTRWSLTGNDLGTTSRSVGATISEQGSWNVGINYDQLRHYITESYQTPLLGTMGGNNFTLPQGFGVVNSQTKPAAVGGVIPPYGAQGITATQKGYFHSEDVYSERQNANFTAGLQLDREWNVQFEFNRLYQDGAKLMAAASDVQNVGGFSAVRGETILTLMNPTNYRTDQVTLAFNWRNDKGYFTGGYYGSFFRDGNNAVYFPNVFTGNAVGLATGATSTAAYGIDALSTPPSNDFHQLNLTGGYAFSQATRLAGGFSYGNNTQNSPFINQDQMQAGGLPQTSLNGEVVTTHADLKLTNQTTHDLTLVAALKYNERDNRTAANTYKFYTLGGDPVTSVSEPMSNRRTQFELAGDYRLTHSQNLHVGYERELIQRWCDSALSNNAQGVGPGGGAVSTYYTVASCVQIPSSVENRFVANYRVKATDDLALNAGLAHSVRNATVNPSFYSPLQGFSEGYELPGYRAFFDASRLEDQAKFGANWQLSERFNVTLGGRYTRDRYDDSPLGVQNGKAWSLNLDGTYNYADDGSVSAYLTSQKRDRDLLNAAWSHATGTFFTTPTQTWLNTLANDDFTVGLSSRTGGLLGGKLAIKGDATASFGKVGYSTALNYTNASCTGTSNGGYVCGATPDITSRLLQLKLSGDYTIDKANAVVVGAIYQHLTSNDYYYNAYQVGYTPTSMLPTNQQNPSYSVSTIYAAYRYSFR